MIERTEITVELDANDLETAIREFVRRKGVKAPSYARVELHTESDTFFLSSKTTTRPVHATLRVKNGSHVVKDAVI